MKKKDQKLSLEEYLENDGICCPFCGKEGGIEGSHNFDCFNQEVRMDVVCTLCTENFREIYRFSGWEHEEEESRSPKIENCPECGTDISDETCENLMIEFGRFVQGNVNCPTGLCT